MEPSKKLPLVAIITSIDTANGTITICVSVGVYDDNPDQDEFLITPM